MKAVERYVRNIAEDSRDIGKTLQQHTQLLTKLETHAHDYMVSNNNRHDEQHRIVKNVQLAIEDIDNRWEVRALEAQTQEQSKFPTSHRIVASH